MGAPDSTLSARPSRFVLRPRRSLRAARSAPWQEAAPLLLVASAVLWTGLMVADAGGWSQVSQPPGTWYVYTALDGDLPFGVDRQPWAFLSVNGGKVIVALSALLTSLALAGRRWPSVVTVAAISFAFVGWVGNEQRLGYVTVQLERPSSPSGMGLETAITVYGVVGLLLAVALLTALSWAVAGSLANRRAKHAGDAQPPRSRRSPQGTAALLVGAPLLALALPRLGLWLRDLMESLLGTAPETGVDAASFDDFGSYGAHTLWLLIAAILVIFIGALVLPRRAPAAAVALTLLSLGLLIPAFWMLGPLLDEILPLGWLVENGAFGFWFLAFTLGFAVATRCFARAATAAATTRNAPTQVERESADHPGR